MWKHFFRFRLWLFNCLFIGKGCSEKDWLWFSYSCHTFCIGISVWSQTDSFNRKLNMNSKVYNISAMCIYVGHCEIYFKNHHLNKWTYIKVMTFLFSFFFFTKLNQNETHTECYVMRTAKKCSSECTERNLAHLQTYEVSEASEPRASSNASEKIPVGNLCVSRKKWMISIQTINRISI